MTLTRDFTNSETVTWRRCRRKWWVEYYLKLAPRRSHVNENREIGNVVHAVLAEGYSSNWERDAVADVAYHVMALEASHPDCETCEPRIHQIKDYSEAIVLGYIKWLEDEGADSDYEWVASEEPVTVVTGWERALNYAIPIRLRAKLDARFQRISDAFRFFMDHKSVQNLSDIPKTAHLDTQFLWYMMMERALSPEGEHTDGGVVNMLRRVKRTSRAKPPFFGRHDVRHNDDELRKFWWKTFSTVRDIIETEHRLSEANYDPITTCYPSPTRDCSWDCDHFMVCQMFDDGSDWEDLLKTAYVQIDPIARYEA